MSLLTEVLGKWGKSDIANKYLYHYTDLNALNSILNQKILWMSFVGHSNDKQEFKDGIELFIKEFKNRETQFTFLKIDNFINFLREEMENPRFLPFILCFSEFKDSLSQWRGYANFCKGVSIGFDVDSIERTQEMVLLKKVIYNSNEKQKIINEFLDDFVTNYNHYVGKLAPGSVFGEHNQIFYDLIILVFTIAITFKDESFSEEQEWRLISLSKDSFTNIKTRVKDNSKIMMFRELSIKNNDLADLIFGAIYHEETVQSVDRVLKINSLKINTSFSKIPFK